MINIREIIFFHINGIGNDRDHGKA